MPKSVRVPTPIRLEPLTLIVQIDKVDVFVHWTVFAIAALILANAISRPVLVLVGGLCYMGILFIHEWGHVIAAHKRGSEVLSVKLYPILAWSPCPNGGGFAFGRLGRNIRLHAI
jgi:hypothetical protein